MRANTLRRSAIALATTLALAGGAQAADLLSGFGPDGMFGELALQPNDDESSSLLNLPFAVNFFGTSYTGFYVNNNGNISFGQNLGEYTPVAFPLTPSNLAPIPIIAPWWGDVDTRPAGQGGGEIPVGGNAALRSLGQSGLSSIVAGIPYAGANNVYVGSPNADTLVVTWDQVGYYSQRTDKVNSFQLVLRNRAADTGQIGDFDIDFRYKTLEWTTGEASGGIDGLAGSDPTAVAAQAGYDAGDGVNFFTLPGSRSDAVLNLVNTSNVGEAGLWTFAVREGQTPGSTPDNPILPVVVDGSFTFDFNVQANTRYFIDPDVAIGYDYALQSSDANQSFLDVVVNTVAGDGIYELYLWNGVAFEDSGVMINAGEVYTFGAGVTRFSLRGIELEAGLDPTDTLAFVTGLSFTQSGAVTITQTPLTAPVPEPATIALMLGGLAMVGGIARRRRLHSA